MIYRCIVSKYNLNHYSSCGTIQNERYTIKYRLYSMGSIVIVEHLCGNCASKIQEVPGRGPQVELFLDKYFLSIHQGSHRLQKNVHDSSMNFQ